MIEKRNAAEHIPLTPPEFQATQQFFCNFLLAGDSP